MTQDEKDRIEMERIKLQLELFKKFIDRLLKQGVLVTAQFIAIAALSYAVIWLHDHGSSEINALRIEYKKDLTESRAETRICEQELIRQSAVFNEKISALQDAVDKLLAKKR